jgi:hypothetical protein
VIYRATDGHLHDLSSVPASPDVILHTTGAQ